MLNITIREHIAIIELPSKVVFSNAEQLKVNLRQLIEEGKNNIAIDLSGIEFMDSSGLAVLVTTYKQVDKVAGKVVLLSPSESAQMLIELTRLNRVFDIYSDLEKAIDSFWVA